MHEDNFSFPDRLIDRDGPGDQDKARHLLKESIEGYGRIGMSRPTPRWKEGARRLPSRSIGLTRPPSSLCLLRRFNTSPYS
jgi:hypothetical protein